MYFNCGTEKLSNYGYLRSITELNGFTLSIMVIYYAMDSGTEFMYSPNCIVLSSQVSFTTILLKILLQRQKRFFFSHIIYFQV